MKSTVGICSLLVLAGCASAPDQAVASKDDVVCERTYPTGSKFPITQCFTAEQRKQHQREVDDARAAIGRSNTTATPVGP